MTTLHVEAEGTARAAPGAVWAVWALVSDATRYPQWGRWSAAGYRRPGDGTPRGPGAVLWLRSSRRAYLRYVTSVEKILEVGEGRRLVYTIIGGIPARNYRAEVTLTPPPKAPTSAGPRPGTPPWRAGSSGARSARSTPRSWRASSPPRSGRPHEPLLTC